MLFTRECDYAVRIVRALSANDIMSVADICQAEDLTSPITYKIAKKLEKASIVKSYRGINGGYALIADLDLITLYDVCAAIDPNILITECMKTGYHCSLNQPGTPCKAHLEFCRLQHILEMEMKSKSLKTILTQ